MVLSYCITSISSVSCVRSECEHLTVFIDLMNCRWCGAAHNSVMFQPVLMTPWVHPCSLIFQKCAVMPTGLLTSRARVHSCDIAMSSVSVMYNYFGFTSLPSTMAWIHKAGLSSSDYTDVHICTVKFIESGMHNHATIWSLATCSDLFHRCYRPNVKKVPPMLYQEHWEFSSLLVRHCKD